MEIIEINDNLLAALHLRAADSERRRMNYDLRTTADDTSQRMLNALEVGTRVPIHRHLETSETTICLHGCMDVVFYDLRPNEDWGCDVSRVLVSIWCGWMPDYHSSHHAA